MAWWFVLAGCNPYELFLVTGGDGTRRSDTAEILFVVDNSNSMVEETVALAENFHVFLDRLTGREEGIETEGLTGAVDQYAAIAEDPGAAVDYQLAITTTDATTDAGRLFGPDPILAKGEPDLEANFHFNLLCKTACFEHRAVVRSDPTHRCEDPFDGAISQEYLDCLCGVDAWVGACGGAVEEPIEAVWNAMCRGLDDPPDSCFDAPSPLDPKLKGSSRGLLRTRTTVVPVVVTDEGDSSRRTPSVELVPEPYVTLFDEIGIDMAWAVIAPALDEDFEVSCPSAATSWGLLRFDMMVSETGGLRLDIDGEDCDTTDWAASLDRLGELVTTGISAFRLPQEPIEDSIAVEVGTKAWEEAGIVGRDVFGRLAYSDGWTYDDEERTVELHGDAIPEAGEDVAIWFLPAAAE
jgi:hypothetical protein